jgi:hypothetical protein
MSPTNKSYVSIQLPLGGHSFSSKALDEVKVDDNCRIVAIVDTARCAAVPIVLLNGASLEEHLLSAGIAIAPNEVAVCNDEQEVAVVMAMNRECHTTLIAKYGDKISFTSPLLATPLPEQGSVLHLSSNTLCVRVTTNGLKFIDAIEVDGDGDIYVRTGRAADTAHLIAGAGWGIWGKLQQNIEVGQTTSLDAYIDNGIYSGVYTNGTTLFETFVMVVINNYAVAAATGTARNITQLKYAVDINGTFCYHVRNGQGADTVEWGEWRDPMSEFQKFIDRLKNRLEVSDVIEAADKIIATLKTN